ncbi:MAG: hypothetical protein ACI4OL_06675 [Gemmiger sp.]
MAQKTTKTVQCTVQLSPRPAQTKTVLCVTAAELEAGGVPPCKVQRVLEELQNQVNADPALNRRPVLLKLGRRMARFLL